MGRFESRALRREALAHEFVTARQSSPGRFWCLACLFFVVACVYSMLGSASADISTRVSPSADISIRADSSPRPAAPEEEEEGEHTHVDSLHAADVESAVELPDPSGTSLGYESDFTVPLEFHEMTDEPETDHLSFDFSLMAVLLALFVICLVPQLTRAATMFSKRPYLNPWPGVANLGAGAMQPTPPGMLLGSNFAGDRSWRVIDVKPGELRGGGGAGGGGIFGSPGFGVDWNGSSAMPWTSLGAQGAGTITNGSWGIPLPSPHTAGTNSFPYSSGNMGPLPLAGSLSTPTFGLGLPGAAGQGAGVANLPTEADCMDTYASHGADLQQWVPRLRHFVDKVIIEPLIRGLEENDKMWQQALSSRGWKLTTEAPQQAYPGLSPQVQEVSVFDRFLPASVLQIDPRASELWNQRQQWESYLIHPGFPPDQRAHVLGRLKEWRDRGIQNSMRCEWRTGQSPTDAHILENILIKMLNMGIEFEKCFLATPHAPPLAKHLGQSPVAYLRQVTDQLASPKAAPHYEVVTMSKVWKFRPGNSNLFEALALLIHALKRHQPRSYQLFPQQLRNAIESTTSVNPPRGGFF